MILSVAGSLLVVLLIGHQSNGQATYSCNANAACGCSANPATLTKIVNGESASAQTWGWAVSLLINGNLQCGGSILSSTWILTAAHCIPQGSTKVWVYAGSTSRFSGTLVAASTAYIYPLYNASGFIHDIALLKLSTPLNLDAAGVDTVCLPSVSAATLAAGEWPAAGTTVVAIGWGKLTETATTLPSTLQQVTLQTVAYTAATCTPVIVDWNYDFCAGVVGGGTCQGDSGGPVMIFNQQWYVVGIVSYGIGCARANYSGVYVRVPYYQSWISSTMSGGSSGLTLSTNLNSGSRTNFNIYFWLLLFVFIISERR